jgi:hypothetical protein
MKFAHPDRGPSRRLLELTSFVKADDIDKDGVMRDLVRSDELLIGMYLNTADNFILFTTDGLHWFSDPVHRSIRYRSISSVRMPDNEADCCLELILEGGELLSLPILNDTENERDWRRVYAFLAPIVFWPLVNDELEKLRIIENRDDLHKYLVENQELLDTYPDTVISLREGFPSLFQLNQAGITPDLLNQPETWRLLGLFLSIRQLWKSTFPDD